MSRPDRPRAPLAAVIALLAAACAPQAGPTAARNVVVVVVDTLRADHLELYGYGRATAPRFDGWARRAGVVFEQARAQAPCTFPSVNSILTSRSPALFYARAASGELGIPAVTPSLAVRLAAAGFATAAVSASPIVRATASRENPSAGFGAGFDEFDEFCYWNEARCVSTRARSMLRELEEPFFLYLHYMDPHDPYQLPGDVTLERPFAAAEPPAPGRAFVAAGDPTPVARHLYGDAPDPALTPAELAHWIDLYDDEIQHWDEQFVPFAAELAERYPATAFVVVADHGEEFLEHDHVGHCRTLYDTELRVPFVLFAPGLEARRSALPATNLDLVPTVLHLLGLPFDAGELEGRSLLRHLGREESAPGGVLQLATDGRRWAAVGGRYKLIQEPAARREERYDLTADPGELQPLAGAPPRELARYRRALGAWRRPYWRAAQGAAEAEKRLRAVGYLN